uniref:Glycerol-3-phosphate acyltransferase 4 n=1 Tax=Oryzias sinensis TaxID=183150 RepID=A0A8C7Y1Y4_9TELE
MQPCYSRVSLLLCLGITFVVWFTILFVIITVPAVLEVSLGIHRFYIRTLCRVFEWATLQIELSAKQKNRQFSKPHTKGILSKSKPLSVQENMQELRSSAHSRRSEPQFDMGDVIYFCRKGVESIIDDEVTKSFSAQELESWNLLTRSIRRFPHRGLRLTLLWGLGVLIRYGILLPLRVILAVTGIFLFVILSTSVGFLPNSKFFLGEKVHLMGYRFCVKSLTAFITYHNSENRPKNGSICVANHTTPLDVIILANDRCYSLVGQVHRGLLGLIQRAMVKSSPHIWFERAEVKDRHLVAKRLCDHAADKTKQPILIFPEGTCVNNTSVMMFKKGSFEIGCTIFPVAIKYDFRFGDAYWNSSKFGLVHHLLRIMSSWALVCSVWYLPPMNREEGEDAVQFAKRVKAALAAQAGLADLTWDGGLKRTKVKDAFKEEQQRLYSEILLKVHQTQKQEKCFEDETPEGD